MDQQSFAGLVAVVTGAGQGIGFEIAKQLCASGAKVVLNDIDPDLATQAAQRISRDGSCVSDAGDAGDTVFIEQLIGTAVEVFGGVDLVVANAGLSLYGSFLDYSGEDFDRVIHLNLRGSFFLAQAAARQMIRQQRGGSMVLMSSVCGHRALKDLAVYSMTKRALEMLARNLVIELSPHRITVNTVAPGATATERTMEFGDYQGAWSAITPMGRPGSTEDIANSVLFLLSEKARHITGQSLVVDGGWTAISVLPPFR